ncbi:MAG: HemK2/MTQ2 family protein methyltransferase [Candidatus Thermoplasmatota archaeon]
MTSKNSKLNYSDISLYLHPDVYEPSEDTFQMLEAIEVDSEEKILEIGTGCGIIALDCAKRGAEVVCSDINPFAVQLAEYNYQNNQSLITGKVNVRYGDLFNVVDSKEKFDVIIFNPPYLPASKENHIDDSGWFNIAVDGGVDGLFLTIRFLKSVKKYLNENGRAYFVFSSLSNQDRLNYLLNEEGFKSRIVNSYCYDGERLEIYSLYN